ncbi:MAG: hypothetical protein LBQ69_02310 [Treponema sp.]|jgi:hypothetical protein|nr:hypothetical protein [Treponema sp.]
MQKAVVVCALYLSILTTSAEAESFRALVAGELTVSATSPEGVSLGLAYNNSAVIRLGSDTRFFRGVEIELSAPQAWLLYQGSLAMAAYAELSRALVTGVNDLDGRRVAFEPLPNRLRAVYQVPVRRSHGLRSGPYATVIEGVVPPASFPLLFRLLPIIKGLSEELETMRFFLTAKPILGDEGAVSLHFRYPEQLRGRPFTVLIDDILVENINEERLLREGEHHLVVLSEEYRNESRRFMVERTKTMELIINLQDLTPHIIFEAPENAQIFLDNRLISRSNDPVSVEPGVHEARFQVGDYSLTRTISVQRGKTYRVALSVDIDVEENE